MKKSILFLVMILISGVCVACAKNEKTNAVELMGAGDKIHDSYTFANEGVVLTKDGDDYLISGSVYALNDKTVKNEFEIADDVTHVVAVKLTAIESEVVEDEVEINVNGTRAYDAEHLNGDNYTYIILEAIPSDEVVISVKWNEKDEEKIYKVKFNEDLLLK